MTLTAAQMAIWTKAKARGWDDEASAVAVAVGSSEGISGNVGDNGCSFGTFQLNFCGGQGHAFAQSIGKSDADAISLLRQNWTAADDWFLANSLGPAINFARTSGAKGAALAVQAGKNAEKPAAGNELAYGTAFSQIAATLGGSLSAGASAIAQPALAAVSGVTVPIVSSGATINEKIGSVNVPGFGDLAGAVGALAGTIAQLPNVALGPVVDEFNRLTSELNYLGQINVYKRIGLVIFGALLTMLGLGFFAFSFVGVSPKQAVKAVAAA